MLDAGRRETTEFRTLELVQSLTRTPGNLMGSLGVVRADAVVMTIKSAIKPIELVVAIVDVSSLRGRRFVACS